MLLNWDILTLEQQQSYIGFRAVVKPPRSDAHEALRTGALVFSTIMSSGLNLLIAVPRRAALAYARSGPERDIAEFLRGQIALHDCGGLQLDPPGFPRLPPQVASRFGDGTAKGGEFRRPAVANEKPQKCPVCKVGILTLFSANANQKTYQCSNERCPSPVLQIQRSDATIKIVAAGSSVVIAGTALAAYLKNHHPKSPPPGAEPDLSIGAGDGQAPDLSSVEMGDLPDIPDVSDIDWNSVGMDFGDSADAADVITELLSGIADWLGF
jgi:hypothetical protein